ncbi:MAG: tetraacyldisaccharide 4'-kinase [Candidatus Omnitrophica bacterium]|nr:tetraacyldisaccharide 4'-kinase [Candidatus Omnitrophota bacterium]
MENQYLLFKEKKVLCRILFPALYLFSLIYGFLSAAIKLAYGRNILRSYRPKLKVISVGNITVGGSGKTPLVEWLVERLQKENKKIGIVIRGYKRPAGSYKGLVKDNSSYFEIGDEASMLKEKFKGVKIGVGEDKAHSARLLEKEGCNVAILDDGFQHWRLKRDLDIVVIDASLPLAGQRLLPLGRLREPLNSLKRADILCLTKTDISQDNYRQNVELLNKINPKALVTSAVYQALGLRDLKTGVLSAMDSDRFFNKPVFILCGIANPLYFEKMVEGAGLMIKRKFIYPDHYQYKKADFSLIGKAAKDSGVNTVITTHKDAVRLKPFLGSLENTDIFSLQVKLKITENEEAFYRRLLFILSR